MTPSRERPRDGIVPVSEAQYRAAVEGRLPGPEQVAPGVWTAALPLPPGQHTVDSTLSYAIIGDDGGVVIVDPGSESEENRARFPEWLASIGRDLRDVRVVVVTHMHPDHFGLADWLRSVSGAAIAMHPADEEAIASAPPPEDDAALLDRWGVPVEERAALGAAPRRRNARPGFSADIRVGAGDVLDLPGHDLVVISTPGHTSGHIGLADRSTGLVFTGDHVLPGVNPGIGLGGPAHDPLGDYLASLDALEPYDDFEVCPGHGYRFRGLRERRTQLVAHHRARSQEIAGILAELDAPTVWRVAERVSWSGGWDALQGIVRRAALSQTETHLRHLGHAIATG